MLTCPSLSNESMNTPSPLHMSWFPKTGPSCPLSSVNQIAYKKKKLSSISDSGKLITKTPTTHSMLLIFQNIYICIYLPLKNKTKNVTKNLSPKKSWYRKLKFTIFTIFKHQDYSTDIYCVFRLISNDFIFPLDGVLLFRKHHVPHSVCSLMIWLSFKFLT